MIVKRDPTHGMVLAGKFQLIHSIAPYPYSLISSNFYDRIRLQEEIQDIIAVIFAENDSID